ncbi:hypothetical protein DND132_2112 [Pseudodesulfovibrio mercurii]|uniref:Uncharacterized protein n=1 Tax=Pseudodesulfovibrio mercurii TaxID=641491 RepID=F0JHT1_9BACT|nr:hypothetical protein [Pseudodesulfovibrio mercurii]EGB15317.1 hypothetical protein DND132_2112 [Pseudodesulfovibrio mercurii]
MLWYAHRIYTREFLAAGLRDLCRSAQATKRGMTLVAGAAVLVMIAAQASIIYGL